MSPRAEPRRSGGRARALVAAFAAVLALSIPAACEPPATGRYVNDEFDFSFMPPKDWKFTASKTADCLARAEAIKDENCKIYVCVAPRAENLITMRDDFLNCEQVKTFIREQLKGQSVECEPAHTWRLRAYQAKYLRMVRRGEGVVWQFVDQKYLIRGALMFTITAYTLGESPEAAREVYEQNIYFLSQAMNSLYFR
ncbi:MAG: hypothetical protein HQK81_04670 [Desulfovibrionaceae bacterium]|nr:hypothetical protein [Desulfovibrionaceae bacterium]MBF0513338.1 hypothetical protein [Desulfovibrionaceae bacterium]